MIFNFRKKDFFSLTAIQACDNIPVKNIRLFEQRNLKQFAMVRRRCPD